MTSLLRVHLPDQRTGLIVLLRLLCAFGVLELVAYSQPSLDPATWTLILVAAIVGNGLIVLLSLIAGTRRWQGMIGVVFDLAYLYLTLSLTHNMFVLIGVGTMAVLLASLTVGRMFTLLAAIVLEVETLQIFSNGSIPTSRLASDGIWLTLLFMVVLTVTLFLMRTERFTNGEALADVEKLRSARERLQAAYAMLGITNDAAQDYQQALDKLLQSGIVDLQQKRGKQTVRGAILLIDPEVFGGQRIYIAAASGLNPADEALTFTGRQGMLTLALSQNTPIFSGDPQRDPELNAITGLNGTHTIAVIPLREQHRIFGMLLIATEARAAFSDDDQALFNVVGAQLTTTLQNMRMSQELHQEQARLIEAEEEARKKLARDLHDGPAQSIALIAMRLNYIRALAERTPDQLGDELYKTEEVARRTSREIRHMLFTLRPLVLETQGLTAALRQFAEKMKETHNQNVIIEADAEADTLFSKNIQGVLFYIAEEAVGNARKHAQAAHIYVRLLHRGNQMLLEIQDDGKGFDLSAVTDNYEKRGSLGMINMRERTEMVDGKLEMTSAPGRGTKITVTVPLELTPVPGQIPPSEAAGDNLPDQAYRPSEPDAGDSADSDELSARLAAVSQRFAALRSDDEQAAPDGA